MHLDSISQEPKLEFFWVPVTIADSLPVLPKAILNKALEIFKTRITLSPSL